MVFFENPLDQMPYRKVPLAVLVPCDITTPFGRLSEVVRIGFLTKTQILPSRHFEPHYLNVSELVYQSFHDVNIRDIGKLFIHL